MAYKFQRGPAVASGSFTAEEGLTSSNGLTVSAGTVTLPATSVATAALVASSVTVGSTSISLGNTSTVIAGLTQLTSSNSSLGAAVASSLNVDSVSLDNNILSGLTQLTSSNSSLGATVASTITGSGLAQFQSLTVDGTSTFASVDINGGAIDGVTIGTSTAVTQFTASNSSLGAAVASSLSSSGNIQAGGTLTVAGASILNGNVTLGDASTDVLAVLGQFTSSLVPRVSGEVSIGSPTNLWLGISGNELSASLRVRAGTQVIAGTSISAGTSITGQTLTASNGATLAAAVVTTITGSSTATFQSMTSNNVTIGGGTINATPIGGTTQAAGQFTTLSASSNLQVGSSITASSGVRVSSGGVTVTDGGLTVSNGDSSVQKLTVNGDLIVLGNTFSASVGSLLIEDKQIVLADGAPNAAAAYGAGFFISGANAEWTFKQNGEGAAASSGEIFVASGSSGLKAIQASTFYGSLVGSMASTVSASVGGATLVTGVNYFGNVGGAVSVTLPASAGLTVGNSVKVKAGSDCSTTNTITINKAGSQTIDGEDFVILESPWAALEFVYVASDTWRIF